jgi:hypothetical protein
VTKESWKKVSADLKLFLEAHRSDQSAFNPPMKNSESSRLSNGINQIWSKEGAENFNTQSGQADDCTQTGSCSCGNETRTVTCSCLKMIHCESRTVTRCDYDDAGNEVNCREVTGCMPMCL